MDTIVTILTIVGGFLSGSIGSAIIGALIKSSIEKRTSMQNYEKVSEKIAERETEKIKKVAFTQTLQPIAESELAKINEKSDEHIEKSFVKVEKQYIKVINILDKLSHIFDNSLVPQETKTELANAIEEAKAEIPEIVEQEIQVVVEEQPKETKKETKVSR